MNKRDGNFLNERRRHKIGRGYCMQKSGRPIKIKPSRHKIGSGQYLPRLHKTGTKGWARSNSN